MVGLAESKKGENLVNQTPQLKVLFASVPSC